MTDEPTGDQAGTDSSGEMLALVIRIEPDQHGRWQVAVDGTMTVDGRPIPPTTLIVRLWRLRESGVLRGTVSLAHDEMLWAPIQSNARLEALVRAWLGAEP